MSKHLDEQLARKAEIRTVAKRQFDDFVERGFTATEIKEEAEANVRYYTELLEQAQALNEMANGARWLAGEQQ